MKIVIIGGVAAGAKVAAKSRRMLQDSEIDIYTQDTHVSYSACGLPFYIEGNFKDWRKLLIRSVEEFQKSNINIHLQHKVVKILPEDKKVLVKNLETGEEKLISYDKLVIATGANAIIPEIENVHLKNIFTLKTLEDGVAIKNAMQNANHITLLGAGYINIELLEAFIRNNKKVTLIEQKHYIMPMLDKDISSLVQGYILENSNNSCHIITDDTVKEFVGKERVEGILTQKGIGFETDMVVIGVGITPNTKFAIDAGIQVGIKNSIKVNSRMETNITDIYACGDCTEKFNIVSNIPVYIASGAIANKEGRVAAMNLCGETEDFQGVLGSFVTRYNNLTISKSGLTEQNAIDLGYSTVATTVTKRNKARYMPEIENITLKLVADKRTHKILGVQAIGSIDADKKVNTISTGLTNFITVEDLLDVDLTYAPPYTTSVDIIHTAARILKNKLG